MKLRYETVQNAPLMPVLKREKLVVIDIADYVRIPIIKYTNVHTSLLPFHNVTPTSLTHARRQIQSLSLS